MKNNLPYLVNIPPFLIRDLDESKLNFLDKISLVIKGKFFGLVIKYFHKNLFCKIINMFFYKDGRIQYKNNMYFKIAKNNRKIFFPNKRILRIVKNLDSQLEWILNSYCVKEINFTKDDLVIDCGANIGEFKISLEEKNIDVKYLGFEPEITTYNCLKKNILDKDSQVINMALSNENKERELYLDSEGGNSSLEKFHTGNLIKIKSIKLDDVEISDNVKLFKLEAEGHEPEVLEGAIETLKKTEYVAVDFGAERGLSEDYTIVEVNKILYENNFELIKFSDFRFIGLYKNSIL
tara:strand:- start:10 stop:888 length:879 start_codon:yes stop_codon:yes gene_type:complete